MHEVHILVKYYTRYPAMLGLLAAFSTMLPAACGDGASSSPNGAGDDVDVATDEELSGQDGSIDAAALDPDTIVFAFKSGGGFLWGELIMYEVHHGRALYVWGDGTVWKQRGPSEDSSGIRQWTRGKVPTEVWNDLLIASASIGPDDGGHYDTCQVLDGGGQSLAVELPGLQLTASAYTAFEVDAADCGELSSGSRKPSQQLVALVDRVLELSQYATEVMVTQQVVLGWYSVELGSGYPCPEDSTVDWPFPALPLAQEGEREIYMTMLTGTQAAEVRTFMSNQWDLVHDKTSSHVCVMEGESAFVVVVDDALPTDREYPFFDGDLE